MPFLEDDGRHVGPANLEWSHRMLGARRAALEEFSPWTAGNGRVACSIFPGDFETNGPHRLVLQTRVRTAGLTDSWAIELPQVPFNFEFDPILRLDAILTLADATRDESIARAIRLEPVVADDGEPASYLPLGGEWTMRNPPRVAVATPLAADLAHAISIEFEGLSGRFPAGRLILSGQGLAALDRREREPSIRRFELGPIAPLPPAVIERPGVRRRGSGSRPTWTAAGPTPTSARSGRDKPRPTGSTSRSCGDDQNRRTSGGSLSPELIVAA